MLTPAELELLTAAVDGELDARQQRRLARLLETSTEARRTLQGLKRDAAALRGLPARTCPADVSGPVLEAIHGLPKRPPRPRPMPVPSQPPQDDVPAWFGLALAASVLFLIGIGSYVYFAVGERPDPVAPTGSGNLAQNTPEPEPEPTPGPGPFHPPILELKPGPDASRPDLGPLALQPPMPMTPTPEIPETPAGPIFTGPSGERFVLRTAEPTAPTLHSFQTLDRQRFTGELNKAGAFRLELPCKDAGKAAERLQGFLKGRNVPLTVDAIATARLARPQFRSSYLLVLEDVTPDELADLLQALAEADRKTGALLPSRLVLSRQNRLDYRDLAEHVGTELPPLPPIRVPVPRDIDPTRPLEEQTAEEIDRQLTAKTPHPALLLAYGVPRQVVPSPDVKKYLDARRTPRPGTLQVMLVLRFVG